jgi:transposase
MIVTGWAYTSQSVTAVAVDEAGRPLAEKVIAVGSSELLGWAAALDGERLWAVEDCRHVTRALERRLLAEGEELVRVPPKLTGAARSAGKERGKSDPIDALAIARAAIREPALSPPRPDERVYREIKLLVDHRDDLVDERRRAQQRLRWHLHQLDPTYQMPLRRLDRATQLERVARWLARREQELQGATRPRPHHDHPSAQSDDQRARAEVQARTNEVAPALLELPGHATLTAAKLLAEIGPIDRYRSTRSSPDTAVSHRPKQARKESAAPARPRHQRVPDIVGITQIGTVYTGGKGEIAEHGGANPQDRDVPILVRRTGVSSHDPRPHRPRPGETPGSPTRNTPYGSRSARTSPNGHVADPEHFVPRDDAHDHCFLPGFISPFGSNSALIPRCSSSFLGAQKRPS